MSGVNPLIIKKMVLIHECAVWHQNGGRSASGEHSNGHRGCDNTEINHLYKLSMVFMNCISCQLKIHSSKNW